MSLKEFHEEVKMVIRRPGDVTVIPREGDPYKVPCTHNFVIVRNGEKMVVPSFTLMEKDLIVTHRRG